MLLNSIAHDPLAGHLQLVVGQQPFLAASFRVGKVRQQWKRNQA